MPAYTNDSGENGRRQLFGALVTFVVALSTAFLPAERQQQLAALVRGSVLRPFVSTQEGLQLARGRTADSSVLRRQLDSLIAVTSGHLALAEENRRLSALMGLTERIGGGWIPANVVRPGTSGSQSMFLLNVGSAQGVQRYSPVVAGQGIVGYVFEVHENDAVAMDWTHPDFAASAMDQHGTVYGMVKSRRGEFR